MQYLPSSITITKDKLEVRFKFSDAPHQGCIIARTQPIPGTNNEAIVFYDGTGNAILDPRRQPGGRVYIPSLAAELQWPAQWMAEHGDELMRAKAGIAMAQKVQGDHEKAYAWALANLDCSTNEANSFAVAASMMVPSEEIPAALPMFYRSWRRDCDQALARRNRRDQLREKWRTMLGISVFREAILQQGESLCGCGDSDCAVTRAMEKIKQGDTEAALEILIDEASDEKLSGILALEGILGAIRR